MAQPVDLVCEGGGVKGIGLAGAYSLLEARGVTTFADLRTPDDDPRWAYRLQVITSDVTARRLLVLPRDAATLGIDPDELEVALAVRASMSIPVFFEPLRIVNERENREHQ